MLNVNVVPMGQPFEPIYGNTTLTIVRVVSRLRHKRNLFVFKMFGSKSLYTGTCYGHSQVQNIQFRQIEENLTKPYKGMRQDLNILQKS